MKMARRILAILLGIILYLTCFAGCGSNTPTAVSDNDAAGTAADAESQTEEPAALAEEEDATIDPPVTLTYSSHVPVTHGFSVLDQDWLTYVQELSDGTVIIDPYYGATLVSGTSSYAELLAGVADIVHLSPGNEAEHFVVENAANTFFYGLTEAQDVLSAVKDAYAQVDVWQQEFDGTTVLQFGSSGYMYLLTAKPVESLEDLKGLTIRATEEQAFTLLTELGAECVRMPLSDVYESLSKGIIDGVVSPVQFIEENGLENILRYATDLHLCGTFAVHKIVSDAAMAKLTEVQRQALIDASLKREEDGVAFIDDPENFTRVTDMGVMLLTLSEEDYAAMNAAAEKLALQQVEALNTAGYDGDGIYEVCREAVAAYAGRQT